MELKQIAAVLPPFLAQCLPPRLLDEVASLTRARGFAEELTLRRARAASLTVGGECLRLGCCLSGAELDKVFEASKRITFACLPSPSGSVSVTAYSVFIFK